MEEIAGNFFDNYEEGFLEYLEVHKAQALKSCFRSGWKSDGCV